MEQHAIFGPVFAMMLLTLAVWVLMYLRRRGFVAANQVKLRDIATPESMARVLTEKANSPANNFRNLCELPMLMYALCAYLFVTGQVDRIYLVLAWVFFAFRVAHSIVHCTTNRVSRRLAFYALSSLALWAMILRAAVVFVMQG